MEKYGVFFGSWRYDEDEPEFVGTFEECDKWYDDHYDDLGLDEWYDIKEIKD